MHVGLQRATKIKLESPFISRIEGRICEHHPKSFGKYTVLPSHLIPRDWVSLAGPPALAFYAAQSAARDLKLSLSLSLSFPLLASPKCAVSVQRLASPLGQ